MDFYGKSKNVALTCRHFGISRQTFYRWLKRYEPLDLTSLEERSHCPHHRRQATWSFSLERKVLTLRLQFPRWGKDKLVVLLRQQGESVSTSRVGRILLRLKQRGQLVEAPRPAVAGSRRALRFRPYAVRKPRQYAVSRPGDLVQVDTLEVRPVPGVVFKQFTARDVISRWDVIQAHGRATAQSATEFLQTLLHRMPFPIRALQVDGGSEFAAQFEPACQQRGLHRFAAAPLSQTQWRGGTRPPYSHGGVLSGHGLLSGNEKAQSRTAALGKDLHHRSPSPVSRLPYSPAVPIADPISTKGMKVSPIYWTSTRHCHRL
jgi:putative transposase